MTEQEKAIRDVMRRICMKEPDADCVFLNLESCGDNKENSTQKLLNYILSKGVHITPRDIEDRCQQICHPLEMYYPTAMFLRYVGPAADELDADSYYEVRMSYDNDRQFCIRNNCGAEAVYPAELFQIMDVSKIQYLGGGETSRFLRGEEGLIEGEVYQVSAIDHPFHYCLDNGMKCWTFHAQAVEFVPAKPKQPRPFRNLECALLSLRSALEHGKVAPLEDGLMPTCQFVCQYTGSVYNDAQSIVTHIKETAREQLEKDIFLDCVLAIVTKEAPGNRFGVGEPCLVVYIEEKATAICFLEMEQKLVNGIYILTEPYEFELE